MAKRKYTRSNPSDTIDGRDGQEPEWKDYAPGVSVISADAYSDRQYSGRPEDLLAAGVIGTDLLQGGCSIYGDKRVQAHDDGTGIFDVYERLIDFERVPGLSVAESEMIGTFRRCRAAAQHQLLMMAHVFAGLNKGTDKGAGKVVDFARYRRKLGHVSNA